MKKKTLYDCKIGDTLIFTSSVSGAQHDHYSVSYVSKKFLCVKSTYTHAYLDWEAIVDKETGTWTDGSDFGTSGTFSAKQDVTFYNVGDKFSTTFGTFVLTAPTSDTRCFINVESGERAYLAFKCEAVTSEELNKGFGSKGWTLIN